MRKNIYFMFIVIFCFHFSACETNENNAPPDEICNNQLDDDGDGDMDCLDTDCAGATICLVAQENCTNGTDDDFDGDVDCNDADCASASTCQLQEDCTNRIDDDGDGNADCDDTDCAGAANCQTPENCTNGIDDDGDGNADCDDTDCAQTVGCLQQVCSIYTVFYDSPQVCDNGHICGVDLDNVILCMEMSFFSSGTFYGDCGANWECPKGSSCFDVEMIPLCLPLCSNDHPSCPLGGTCMNEEFGIPGLYACLMD